MKFKMYGEDDKFLYAKKGDEAYLVSDAPPNLNGRIEKKYPDWKDMDAIFVEKININYVDFPSVLKHHNKNFDIKTGEIYSSERILGSFMWMVRPDELDMVLKKFFKSKEIIKESITIKKTELKKIIREVIKEETSKKRLNELNGDTSILKNYGFFVNKMKLIKNVNEIERDDVICIQDYGDDMWRPWDCQEAGSKFKFMASELAGGLSGRNDFLHLSKSEMQEYIDDGRVAYEA